MKRRRWVIVVLLSPVVLLLAVTGIGAALPVEHHATVSASVPAAPDAVFAVLDDVRAFPEWRPEVERVEVLDEAEGLVTRFREHADYGDVTFEVVERDPPSRLVTRIADTDLGFGGTWTYELAAEGEGTRVTITEDGTVDNPLFRFMARFLFGYETTARSYLESLQRRFASR